jgi:hypothetical protein
MATMHRPAKASGAVMKPAARQHSSKRLPQQTSKRFRECEKGMAQHSIK